VDSYSFFNLLLWFLCLGASLRSQSGCCAVTSSTRLPLTLLRKHATQASRRRHRKNVNWQQSNDNIANKRQVRLHMAVESSPSATVVMHWRSHCWVAANKQVDNCIAHQGIGQIIHAVSGFREIRSTIYVLQAAVRAWDNRRMTKPFRGTIMLSASILGWNYSTLPVQGKFAFRKACLQQRTRNPPARIWLRSFSDRSRYWQTNLLMHSTTEILRCVLTSRDNCLRSINVSQSASDGLAAVNYKIIVGNLGKINSRSHRRGGAIHRWFWYHWN
jgi:hypothetical protein